MNNDRELLQQALDALQGNWRTDESDKAIEALRARLAPPEQEPVAWKMKGVPAFATSRPNDTDSIKWDALYTAPPQREWVGLTDDEKHGAIWTGGEFGDGVLWAEKLLKERNT